MSDKKSYFAFVVECISFFFNLVFHHFQLPKYLEKYKKLIQYYWLFLFYATFYSKNFNNKTNFLSHFIKQKPLILKGV